MNQTEKTKEIDEETEGRVWKRYKSDLSEFALNFATNQWFKYDLSNVEHTFLGKTDPYFRWALSVRIANDGSEVISYEPTRMALMFFDASTMENLGFDKVWSYLGARINMAGLDSHSMDGEEVAEWKKHAFQFLGDFSDKVIDGWLDEPTGKGKEYFKESNAKIMNYRVIAPREADKIQEKLVLFHIGYCDGVFTKFKELPEEIRKIRVRNSRKYDELIPKYTSRDGPFIKSIRVNFNPQPSLLSRLSN